MKMQIKINFKRMIIKMLIGNLWLKQKSLNQEQLTNVIIK